MSPRHGFQQRRGPSFGKRIAAPDLRSLNLRLIAAAFLVLLGSTPAIAQQPASSAPGPADEVRSLYRSITTIFEKPIHPIINTVAPRGWVGAGVEIAGTSANQALTWQGEALATLHAYTDADGAIRYERGTVQAEVFGRARDMTRLDFWGLGGGSRPADRTDFEYLDRSAGVMMSVQYPRLRSIRIGGRIERLWPGIGPESDGDLPSIADRYTDVDAPGLAEQPPFTVYTGFVDAGALPALDPDRVGRKVRVTYQAYRDRQGAAFTFDRVSAEGWQRLRGLRDEDRWTAHEYLSMSNVFTSGRVPFYLQETLGGFDAIRPFDDAFAASDGTNATLRGFSNLRFRGASLVLLQAEYRVSLKRWMDISVFGDTGEAAATTSALRRSDLRPDAGVGVTFKANARTSVRVDVAAGREGPQWSLSVTSVLQ